VVRFATDDLGEGNAQAVSEQLNGLADGLERPRLRLDFGGVTFLTSTTVGNLVTLHKRVRAADGKLMLVNLTDLVHEIFDVTRLTELLDIRDVAENHRSAPASALAW
jgi:anti-anti-sigma factor